MFLLTPFAALLVCVIAHVSLTRVFTQMYRLKVFVYSFLAGSATTACLTVLFHFRVTPPWTDTLGYGGLWGVCYLCLTYCYFFGFYNTGESARRIRLLIELDRAGAKGLTLAELLSAYNAKTIINARLDRLLSSGQLIEKEGRLTMGVLIALRIAQIMVQLKILFLGTESEFGHAAYNTNK
jgi:hypothetical protein